MSSRPIKKRTKAIANPWANALKHLKRDAVLRRLIAQVGPCTLRRRPNYFLKLVQSILSQQVSVQAAATMYKRLAANFPRKTITPDRLVSFLTKSDEATIRACGLSRQKRGYLLDLATHFASKKINTRNFSRMTDDQIVAALLPIKGIGRWTVEMLLIFGMNRTDVWPVDDLGLQEGLRQHFGLATRPKPKEIVNFGDAWRPWRSIATWYLWRAERPKYRPVIPAL
ncbi:MAG: DNA-3-methyladenine glycosylase 2 family protein [Burkholderiales bacterium]|nr:DNA-3-methyladenine glycosylase 2 family protein [Phycisphaerae bacterium]